ncbi:MAG: zf-HC2 domain-containing protein [Caldilineaceae bacterium]|nr:zf-HC2 domain-containing protein [Caldilineaceae bacterium]
MAARKSQIHTPPGPKAVHDEYLMLASLELDGMLDAGEQRRLDAHLQRCSDCRVQWQLWQLLDQKMQAEPVPQPAPGFSQRIVEELIRQERRRNLQIGIFLTVLTVCAWALALVGAGVLAAALVYTNLGSFAAAGSFLAETWAVSGVICHSLWDVATELTAAPTALGVASVYLVITTVALGVWCLVIQRGAQPVRARYYADLHRSES